MGVRSRHLCDGVLTPGLLGGSDLRVRCPVSALPIAMGMGTLRVASTTDAAEWKMAGQPHLSGSPQARGRELARQGKHLWQELGSVKSAATELMNRNRDIPSIQAFRYAAGLSQDQAATRYNETSGHQTSLGGTTINAWETWARIRGAGSPPTFSSLLILATAYGRGPLGVANEMISPGDWSPRRTSDWHQKISLR